VRATVAVRRGLLILPRPAVPFVATVASPEAPPNLESLYRVSCNSSQGFQIVLAKPKGDRLVVDLLLGLVALSRFGFFLLAETLRAWVGSRTEPMSLGA
jgi:hypothetical protein